MTDVTKTTATVSFTPKDNAMTYYYFVASEADRAKMIEKYCDIQTADFEYLQYSAGRLITDSASIFLIFL